MLTPYDGAMQPESGSRFYYTTYENEAAASVPVSRTTDSEHNTRKKSDTVGDGLRLRWQHPDLLELSSRLIKIRLSLAYWRWRPAVRLWEPDRPFQFSILTVNTMKRNMQACRLGRLPIDLSTRVTIVFHNYAGNIALTWGEAYLQQCGIGWMQRKWLRLTFARRWWVFLKHCVQIISCDLGRSETHSERIRPCLNR